MDHPRGCICHHPLEQSGKNKIIWGLYTSAFHLQLAAFCFSAFRGKAERECFKKSGGCWDFVLGELASSILGCSSFIHCVCVFVCVCVYVCVYQTLHLPKQTRTWTLRNIALSGAQHSCILKPGCCFCLGNPVFEVQGATIWDLVWQALPSKWRSSSSSGSSRMHVPLGLGFPCLPYTAPVSRHTPNELNDPDYISADLLFSAGSNSCRSVINQHQGEISPLYCM